MAQTITRKTQEEIRILRDGGRILAKVLRKIEKAAKPGVTLSELNRLTEKGLAEYGAEPAFKDYIPQLGVKPFPAAICTSVNHVVVHGIPKEQTLKEGDIISLDLGVQYRGFYTDAAITLGIGRIRSELRKLMRVTEEALRRGIKNARPGKTTGDIGYAIEAWVRRNGFSIIRELTGHGVGYCVHEAPYIPNFGSPGGGIKLEPGMVVAIEPMVALGSGEIEMLKNGSFVTKDGSAAAHFEHTVAITVKGPLILTK